LRSSYPSNVSLPHLDADKEVANTDESERYQIAGQKHHTQKVTSLELFAGETWETNGEREACLGVLVECVKVEDGPGNLDTDGNQPDDADDHHSIVLFDDCFVWKEDCKVSESITKNAMK